MRLGKIERELLMAEAGREDQLRPCWIMPSMTRSDLGGLWHILRLDELEAGNVALHLVEPVLHGAVVTVVIDAADIDRPHDERRLVLRGNRAGGDQG